VSSGDSPDRACVFQLPAASFAINSLTVSSGHSPGSRAYVSQLPAESFADNSVAASAHSDAAVKINTMFY